MKTQTAMQSSAGTAAKQSQAGSLVERMNQAYDAIARRAFELFAGRGYQDGHDLEDWLAAEGELFMPVPVEVTQDEKQAIVKAQVPGFDRDDIRVSVDDGRLLISGVKKKNQQNESAGTSYSSESHQEFLRVLDLPGKIDQTKAEARLERGTLTITLPRVSGETSAGTEIRIR